MQTQSLKTQQQQTKPSSLEATVFGYKLKTGQLNIIGSILDPLVKRIIVSAYTQYGKTRAVAIAVLLYILANPNKKILFIAPTIKQTNIIRNYVADIIAKIPRLQALVDQPRHRGPESLKSEMSKERLTFKNGCEIVTLTAHGTEGEQDPGAQLMGFGGDLIIPDEAALILDSIYRKRIKRMLTANPNAKLVILVNPWKTNHFAYRAWKSKLFRKIHIPWQQGVQEGRVTKEFIEEMREELTPIEFKVLYDSEFPTDTEDSLIKWAWIEQASERQVKFKSAPQQVHGLDVAEKGTDLTILTDALTDGESYQIIKQTWLKTQETMDTANKAASLVPLTDNLNVDSIGVGAGVYSRLKELGYRAVSIRVSESPTTEEAKKRFSNLKAQRWWQLRTLFEHGKIGVPKEPKLMSQLSMMRYEIDTRGKIKIVDPEGKSPDYGDSCMLTLLDNSVEAPMMGNLPDY